MVSSCSMILSGVVPVSLAAMVGVAHPMSTHCVPLTRPFLGERLYVSMSCAPIPYSALR